MSGGNLKSAPGFFTPALVGELLDQADRLQGSGELIPVLRIAPSKPKLETVSYSTSPGHEHASASEPEAAHSPARPRLQVLCEEPHRAPRQAARSASSREPAPISEARAHSFPDGNGEA